MFPLHAHPHGTAHPSLMLQIAPPQQIRHLGMCSIGGLFTLPIESSMLPGSLQMAGHTRQTTSGVLITGAASFLHGAWTWFVSQHLLQACPICQMQLATPVLPSMWVTPTSSAKACTAAQHRPTAHRPGIYTPQGHKHRARTRASRFPRRYDLDPNKWGERQALE